MQHTIRKMWQSLKKTFKKGESRIVFFQPNRIERFGHEFLKSLTHS